MYKCKRNSSNGHLWNIISLGTDRRLCIWTYDTLELIHEFPDITSNWFFIHCTNYLFYIQSNSIFIHDIYPHKKIPIPFLHEEDMHLPQRFFL